MSDLLTATFDEVGFRIRARTRRLGFLKQEVPPDRWAATPELKTNRAVRFLLAAIEEGGARIDGDAVLLPHARAVGLPSALADALSLPPLSKLSVTLDLERTVEHPDALIRARWHDKAMRVVTPQRTGCVLSTAEVGRLSPALFALLAAIDGYNATRGQGHDVRIAAWAPVQAALREATGNEATGSEVRAGGFLGSLTIFQAGAFALDVRERIDGPDFTPVLMARSKARSLEDDAPAGDDDDAASAELRDAQADGLLPPDLEKAFLQQAFSGNSPTRDAYVLGRNQFVVLSPELKGALDVVRAKRRAPAEERRRFVCNPRSFLVDPAGGGDGEQAALLFVETRQYSQRVLGLGVWEPPKLPWLVRRGQTWLPEQFPLRLGGRDVFVSAEAFEALVSDFQAVSAEGAVHMEVAGQAYPIAEVGAAIEQARGFEESPSESREGGDAPVAEDPHVLIIETNLEGQTFQVAHRRRSAHIARVMPGERLRTAPKPHQDEGLRWLIDAWAAGWPGVLLADDMGLGKTFQALAFLAWVRANAGTVRLDPILIVAPTALLANWVAEAERHLAPLALGDMVCAFGGPLAQLKRPKTADWTPDDALDIARLGAAGVVLTTYETLANHHRAFARVPFSVAVFDEMQKVKSPGTINTHAAKAMNADFVLGLTGTPIENRLEDLWCLMDRIVPGYLGDLKSFSAAHSEEDDAALRQLKAKLDQPLAGVPPVMLRRMKEDLLEGLPPKTIKSYPVPMPPPQADAYGEAVRAAKVGGREPQAMLTAVHALRGISLHPDGGAGGAYSTKAAQDWVNRSARVQCVCEILRTIEERREKALVFIEDRAVQETFATAVTTLFDLGREPLIINGEVPGARRQAMVDRFQDGPRGFDLLILSPKAAGVGLTITAANHVIHLSRWWNPAVEDQCNDRVYRIGQDRPVTVHVPIAVHPVLGEASFDCRLDELLARKRTLSREMLSPPVGAGDPGALFSATIDTPGAG